MGSAKSINVLTLVIIVILSAAQNSNANGKCDLYIS